MSRTKYADLLALYVNSGNFSILYISILTFYMNCNSTWFLFWTVKLYVKTQPLRSTSSSLTKTDGHMAKPAMFPLSQQWKKKRTLPCVCRIPDLKHVNAKLL